MDDPDDPLERAALAVATALGQDPAKWREYLPIVRLVVEALDEPSVAMVNAGNQAMRQAWASRALRPPAVAGDAAVSAAWEAMIDRLLGYRLPDRDGFVEGLHFDSKDYPELLFDNTNLGLYRGNFVLIGTAFVMNEHGDMLTTRHIAERCGPDAIFIEMADGSRSRATIIAVSDKYDLAVLHTEITQDQFAAVRVNEERFTLVPTSGEEVFAPAFGEVDKAGFEVELRSGTTMGFVGPQETASPLSAIRLDVGRCPWGSPVLDDAAILIGIVSAREGEVDHCAGEAEYGKNAVLMLNGNAIVDFANEHGLAINAWHKGVSQHRDFVKDHLRHITAMVCRSKSGDGGEPVPAGFTDLLGKLR